MATENEKLCMAIINNSVVTNIDWNGVGAELNLKVNSAQKRWKRFKDTSKAAKSTNGVGKKPSNGAETGVKRGIEEIEGTEEKAVRKLPMRKSRGGRIMIQSPSSNEEDEEIDLNTQGENDKEFGREFEEGDMVEA